MNPRPWLPLLALALAGCASTSPKQADAQVAELLAARGEPAPPWDRQSPEDAQVARRVDQLLALPLTPDSAVEVALLRNPGLIATYQSVGVAQADLAQAGLLSNPRLGLSVGFPVGGSGAVALGGSLVGDFLELFTLPLRKHLAQGALREAELRVGDAVVALAAQVRAQLVRVQAAQQRCALEQTWVTAEDAAAELSARQAQAGNISELRDDGRQVLAEQARVALLKSRAQVEDAREALTALLGVPGTSAWTLAATLPALPAADPPLAELESKALTQRLDLAAAHAEVERLTQALALRTHTRLLPGVDLGIAAERDSEGTPTVGPTLDLELPIFDQHQGQVARLQAQLRGAQAMQRERALAVAAQVRAAHRHLAQARSVIAHYQTALLPLQARMVALAQKQYDAMLLGVYGLILARQAELSTDRAYIEAVRDYWLARVALERAVGARLPAATQDPR